MPTLTASAPRADASSAVMAQAKTNRWGSQANNEMNSEAHWMDGSGLRYLVE